MTYEEMFAEIKEAILANYNAEGFTGHMAVQVNITGEGEGIFYIEIKDGVINVEPYNYYDNDCTFILSAKNFLKMCEGSLNPVLAFTTGKLKIDGSVEKALEFANLAKQGKAKAEEPEKETTPEPAKKPAKASSKKKK